MQLERKITYSLDIPMDKLILLELAAFTTSPEISIQLPQQLMDLAGNNDALSQVNSLLTGPGSHDINAADLGIGVFHKMVRSICAKRYDFTQKRSFYETVIKAFELPDVPHLLGEKVGLRPLGQRTARPDGRLSYQEVPASFGVAIYIGWLNCSEIMEDWSCTLITTLVDLVSDKFAHPQDTDALLPLSVPVASNDAVSNKAAQQDTTSQIPDPIPNNAAQQDTTSQSHGIPTPDPIPPSTSIKSSDRPIPMLDSPLSSVPPSPRVKPEVDFLLNAEVSLGRPVPPSLMAFANDLLAKGKKRAAHSDLSDDDGDDYDAPTSRIPQSSLQVPMGSHHPRPFGLSGSKTKRPRISKSSQSGNKPQVNGLGSSPTQQPEAGPSNLKLRRGSQEKAKARGPRPSQIPRPKSISSRGSTSQQAGNTSGTRRSARKSMSQLS